MIWKLFLGMLILVPLIWIALRLSANNFFLAETSADAIKKNDWIEIYDGELNPVGCALVIGNLRESSTSEIVACIGVLQVESYQALPEQLKKVGEYVEVNGEFFVARMLLGAIPHAETALSAIQDTANLEWAKAAAIEHRDAERLPRLLVAVGQVQHIDTPEAASEFERVWQQSEAA